MARSYVVLGSSQGATVAAPAGTRVQKERQATDIGKFANDAIGKSVRCDKALMEQICKHIGPEAKGMKRRCAGNKLACVFRRVDAGGRQFGNAWVGTCVSFPQRCGCNNTISTTEERIKGRLARNINGRKRTLDGAGMKAMLTYLKFLSTGIAGGARTLRSRPTRQTSWPNVTSAGQGSRIRWRATRGPLRRHEPAHGGIDDPSLPDTAGHRFQVDVARLQCPTCQTATAVPRTTDLVYHGVLAKRFASPSSTDRLIKEQANGTRKGSTGSQILRRVGPG